MISVIMERNKFYNYCNNIWSKPYRHVVVDKVRNLIYDDIFEEQESDSDSDRDFVS